MNLLLKIFIVMCFISGIQAQTITIPPQTDVIIIDNGTVGKADPNDRIRYKVTIQNTSGPDGTGTQLNVVPDPRTTLVPGSFRSSPLAINDTYTCTGNVGINIPAVSGLKSNDFDDNIAAATITAGTFATTQGGSIVIAADGGFVYTPTAGFTGIDTYNYTLNDSNGVGGDVPATDMATVTITVSNLIWFIDNSSVSLTSDGRLSSPFKTLADFNASAGPLAGHLIYIQHTGTNYTGGIVLKNNQTLFGTGHTGAANLSSVLPFALAPNSITLPNINGTRSFITNSAGPGILLASGNSIRGVEAGTTATADYAIRDNNATVGSLSMSDVAISGATGGFRVGNGGALSATFAGISTSGGTGGTNGINLTGCTGSFTVNGGTISNPSGSAVLISGGSVTFSSSGTITNNSGFAVDINDHDSNNITFSGSITSSGSGIRVQNCNGGTKAFSGNSKSLTTTSNSAVTLVNNTGATINFSNGGLVISTITAIGFSASGGGSVNVQGTGNIINSISASALNVTNTTIGSNGLTFQSISSGNNTAAADPANGIVLNNTGTSAGLTVTGNGTTSGSGGTIQNTVGADGSTSGNGIYLNNTRFVNLNYMQLNDHPNNAILANGVRGFSLTRCRFTGNNGTSNSGTYDESVISLVDVGGVVSMRNSFFSGGAYNTVRLDNTIGTAPVIDSFVVDTDTFSTMQGSVMDVRSTALLVHLMDGTIDARIRNSRFTYWWGNAIHVLVQQNAGSSVATISNNFCDNTSGALAGSGGIWVAGGPLTYTISNNSVRNTNGTAISADRAAQGSLMTGNITGNMIGVSGMANSGSMAGNGIFASHYGPGTTNITIHNNVIRQINGAAGAIWALMGDNIATGGPGTFNVTMTGNNIQESGTMILDSRMGILVTAGVTSGGGTMPDADIGCFNIGGPGALANTIANFNTGSPAAAQNRIRINQRFHTTARFPGYTGGNNDPDALGAYLLGRNNASNYANASNVGAGGPGFTNTPGGVPCAQ